MREIIFVFSNKKKKKFMTDYNSGNGFQTAVWGPSLWHHLHIISFNYPVNPTKEQQKNYHDYLMSLQQVLPCKYCRDNFSKNLKSAGYSLACLKDRNSMSRFMFDFHNEVNKMLGKTFDMSFEEVRDLYEGFRSRCGGTKDKEKNSKEKGCITSMYGTKSKCSLFITPRDESDTTCRNIWVHPDCKLRPKNTAPKPNDMHLEASVAVDYEA